MIVILFAVAKYTELPVCVSSLIVNAEQITQFFIIVSCAVLLVPERNVHKTRTIALCTHIAGQRSVRIIVYVERHTGC